MLRAMVERPTGTVTFLFTDVEGSTRLWEDYPAEMQVALERHDEILRDAIESHGGYVFSTGGDAFAAAFARVGDALSAASEIQEHVGAEAWPEWTLLSVRMGVHTGATQERDGERFGGRHHVGFSESRCRMSRRSSGVVGGRPGSLLAWVEWRAMCRRCHRSRVSGVTIQPLRCGRGSAAAIAPSRDRSSLVRAGRSITFEPVNGTPTRGYIC
jgi:hypothetical protein